MVFSAIMKQSFSHSNLFCLVRISHKYFLNVIPIFQSVWKHFECSVVVARNHSLVVPESEAIFVTLPGMAYHCARMFDTSGSRFYPLSYFILHVRILRKFSGIAPEIKAKTKYCWYIERFWVYCEFSYTSSKFKRCVKVDRWPEFLWGGYLYQVYFISYELGS